VITQLAPAFMLLTFLALGWKLTDALLYVIAYTLIQIRKHVSKDTPPGALKGVHW